MIGHVIKLMSGVDVTPIVAELESKPELWDVNTARRDDALSPHTDMSDIWVRFNRPEVLRDNPHLFSHEHHPVWYPAWSELPSIRSIVFDMMAMVDGEELGGVLITRIPAGGRIQPHIDKSWHVDYYNCKIYLSLKSEPGADFVLDYDDGQIVLNPKVGEAYRIDNRQKHSVVNDSDGERMTLIVCIRSQLFDGYFVEPYKGA